MILGGCMWRFDESLGEFVARGSVDASAEPGGGDKATRDRHGEQI